VLGASFRGQGSTGSAQITGLQPNHRYFIAIESFNSAGAGFPFIARTIRTNNQQPSIPTNLRAAPINPATVHLTWDSVASSGGYALLRRSTDNGTSGPFSDLGAFDTTCADIGFQFPGVDRYE
jgi:hypothetical protein